MDPLGLYIHIPFCKRKCAYCDFVSYPGCESQMDSYIEMVIAEARLYADALFSRVIDTVFVGGGTPSLLSPKQFAALTEGLKKSCQWNAAEFTVEANPETLDADKLAAYADCGVNRISLGLQTHDDTILARIGRRHTWDTFRRAYEQAVRVIPNINVDTIFGLPGQTLSGYLETLSRVLELQPAHVSSYALKLEAGTPLAAEFAGADEDLDRDMYHAGVALLESAGLMQYETSNFALPGFECRHNLKYWTGGEYIGLGVAAHSFMRNDPPIRFGNIRRLDEYLRMVGSGIRPVAQREVLSPDDEREEYIMLRLRLKQGISFADYKARFGRSFISDFAAALKVCENAGLIVQKEQGIFPTLRGFDLQNTLIGAFLERL
jgi:oxygen-independent coproporphyrinogen-3 oxidase